MTTVVIAGFELCNLDSIARASDECGGGPVITERKQDVLTADHGVLPEEGSFAGAATNIRDAGLGRALIGRMIRQGAHFLGVYLGMQFLACKGEESGASHGLGWTGVTVNAPTPADDSERPPPHIGWNEVHPLRS